MAHHPTDPIKPSEPLAAITADLEPFRRFARARLGQDDLADEALQEALLKAVRHVGDVRDEDDLTRWFWTILRRAIVDLGMARRRLRDREQTLVASDEVVDTSPPPRDVCACLQGVIDRLPAKHAEVLRAADLSDRPPTAVAADLGIAAGTLAVRRHRAREALTAALQRTCRTCATHGCVDCTCRPPADAAAESR